MEIPDETPQDVYLIDNLPGYVDQPFELDKEKLDILVEDITEGEYGKIHSLIVIHYDNLVLEKYFMGWTRHMRHRLFSVTKSFSSALIGIAIEQGYIDGVNKNLLSFFPEYDDIENLDARKESITLENVLTMTPGFKWDDSPLFDKCGDLNPESDTAKMSESSDWIKYVLDLPMRDDPSTEFLYNNGGSHLLSGILTNKTGQSAEEYASENLFSALGITNWEWEKDPNDLTNTEGGLFLHPVNMAMFGYLFLKNGFLNEEQVISEDWVKESTSRHIEIRDPDSGEVGEYYGYQWWFFKDGNTYSARGLLGQFIFVIPGLNMVIVTTAENFEDPLVSAADILTNIVDALVVKN
jgi:CubicO group peptidase (beta-lactamase class C family)